MTSGKKRISNTFQKLKDNREKGLITYVTACYPDFYTNLEVLKTLADSGADLIEIGIPFSDPIADGPVIQNASHLSLTNGTKLGDIYKLVNELRQYTKIPLLLMSYYNPIYKTGLEVFVSKAVNSGADGLIIPDLPVDEDSPLRQKTNDYGMALVPMAAPTSSNERLQKIAAKADSFIYCVSVTGVTGVRAKINTCVQSFTSGLREYTNCPLALGFGISGPETASEMATHCDAVVVGSLIVSALDKNNDTKSIRDKVKNITRSIKVSINYTKQAT